MNSNKTIKQPNGYDLVGDVESENIDESHERVLSLAHILLEYAKENNFEIDTSLTDSQAEGTLEE